MKHKRKIGIFLAGLLLLCSSCQSQTTQKSTEQQEKSTTLVSLQEVREQLDADMEEAYSGKYDKMKFMKFEPQMTDEDQVGDIYQVKPQCRDDSMTMEECAREQYQWLCDMAGEKLDKKQVRDIKSGKYLDEVERMFKNGTYPEKKMLKDGYAKPNLTYTGKDGHSFEANSGKGIVIGEWKRIKTPSEDMKLLDKVYYANATDDSLDDSYELADGPCTVREAIAWAEEYENEKKPFKPGKDFRIRAANARVYQLDHGKYAYCICMRREYKGTLFQGILEGTSCNAIVCSEDMYTFVMVDKDTPDMIISPGANEKITPEGETYDKIMPLSRAFELLNNHLGRNTKCKVRSAELSYFMSVEKREYTDHGYEDQSHGVPVWKIETVNESDETTPVFYIGVTDWNGERIRVCNYH